MVIQAQDCHLIFVEEENSGFQLAVIDCYFWAYFDIVEHVSVLASNYILIIWHLISKGNGEYLSFLNILRLILSQDIRALEIKHDLALLTRLLEQHIKLLHLIVSLLLIGGTEWKSSYIHAILDQIIEVR